MSKGLEAPIVFLIDDETSAERTPTNYWLIDWHPMILHPHMCRGEHGRAVGAWRGERRKVARALTNRSISINAMAMTRAANAGGQCGAGVGR